MRGERWTARNDAIVALHRIGFSTYELADLFGITQQSAWAVLKRRGLVRARPTKADTSPTRAAGAAPTGE